MSDTNKVDTNELRRLAARGTDLVEAENNLLLAAADEIERKDKALAELKKWRAGTCPCGDGFCEGKRESLDSAIELIGGTDAS